MSPVVLRRATHATWESIGPRVSELNAFDVDEKARRLARTHPAQDYAVGEVKKILRCERQVVEREAGKRDAWNVSAGWETLPRRPNTPIF